MIEEDRRRGYNKRDICYVLRQISRTEDGYYRYRRRAS